MRRRYLGVARRSLRSHCHPSSVSCPRQQAAAVSRSYRPLLFRPMSDARHPSPPADRSHLPAAPSPVTASVPESLHSLLSVCVDGLCSRRLHWEELRTLVEEGRLEAMGRLDWQLTQYAESKADMLRHYHSVTDRLRDKRLAAPCRLDGGRWRCDWTQQSSSDVEPAPPGHPMRVMEDDDGLPLRVCWWENEFGYAIDESIGHHLVWSDRYLCPNSRLFQLLLSEYRPASDFEVLTFINPPHLRSVPDLHHIHVFSRPITKQQQDEEKHDAPGTVNGNSS